MNNPIATVIKLLENFSISAWILDSSGQIVYMNPAMQEIFGDLNGQNSDVIYDNKTDRNADFATEVVITDVPFRRLGSVINLSEDGQFRVEYFEDISEQKVLHNNMARALAKISGETKMAKTIQRSILPPDGVYWDVAALSSLYLPADDLGGDFYDLLKLNDDEYLFYIADVSGHGIQTALLTVFMRERVRTNLSAAAIGPAELLANLVKDYLALEAANMMYVTMVVCKYRKSSRELLVSNAGHNCFPLIIRENGRSENVPTRGLPISALAEGEEYAEEVVSLKPGDRIILFTDGIVEEVDRTTGRSFGAEGVREMAEKNHEHNGAYLARKIMDESAKYALITAKDDRSIVIADILA